MGGRNFHQDLPDALRDQKEYYSNVDMPNLATGDTGFHGSHVAGMSMRVY